MQSQGAGSVPAGTYTYQDYANWYKYYYANYYGATPSYPPPGYPAGSTGTPWPSSNAYSVPPPPGTEETGHRPPPTTAPPPAGTPVISSPPTPAVGAGRGIVRAQAGFKRAGLGAPTGPSAKKSKNKVPVPPVRCAICDITVSSEQVYATHINGKAHKKKAAALGSVSEAVATSAQTPIATPIPHPTTNEGEATASPKKKTKKRPTKSSKLSAPAEQIIFQCDLCSVTVNSQQQLDLHLAGTKHRKTMNRLSKSQDPEVQAKLAVAREMTAKVASSSSPSTNGQPLLTSEATHGTKVASEEPSESPNLPPGYVLIPASQSETGKDTFLCSTCRHQSTDLFTLNVHINSDDHKQKSAEQEKPLEIHPIDQQQQHQRLGHQEKAEAAQTCFSLNVQQTAQGARSWKPSAAKSAKKFMPLSASFVTGEVLK